MNEYLQPTWFVESEHPAVVAFARDAVGDETDHKQQAIRLFYAVRDQIRYSAYGLRMEPEALRASTVLAEGRGWCVSKSCLLAAVARSQGLPCRLGYANVRNHLATQKLLALMKTDVFYYHGYNEFWLGGRWVKATVAFNVGLCEKAGLKPLDFDGEHDSLYHPFDIAGREHMEYLHDYGAFADLPYDAMLKKFAEVYPMREMFDTEQAALRPGDFEAEIEAERKAQRQA